MSQNFYRVITLQVNEKVVAELVSNNREILTTIQSKQSSVVGNRWSANKFFDYRLSVLSFACSYP